MLAGEFGANGKHLGQVNHFGYEVITDVDEDVSRLVEIDGVRRVSDFGSQVGDVSQVEDQLVALLDVGH